MAKRGALSGHDLYFDSFITPLFEGVFHRYRSSYEARQAASKAFAKASRRYDLDSFRKPQAMEISREAALHIRAEILCMRTDAYDDAATIYILKTLKRYSSWQAGRPTLKTATRKPHQP